MNFNGVRQILKAKLLEFQFRIQEMEGVEWYRSHLSIDHHRWGPTTAYQFSEMAYHSAETFDEYKMFAEIVLSSDNYENGFAFSDRIIQCMIDDAGIFDESHRRPRVYKWGRAYLDWSFNPLFKPGHRDTLRHLYFVRNTADAWSFVRKEERPSLLNVMLFRFPHCHEDWEWNWDFRFRDKYWKLSDRFRQGLVVMSGLGLPNELEREVLGWLGCL